LRFIWFYRQKPSLANKTINKTRQLITQDGLNSLS